MSQERQRSQLVVALGDGELGEERREQLDRAAAREGLKVSTWARRVLLEAAGLEHGETVDRAEFDALRRRVVALESRDRGRG